MRAFAQADRFVSELQSRRMRPAYVFVGDEAFFRRRFRDAILEHLVPADLRDFGFFEFDLGETDLAEVLDRARTPSLMAPFQVFFVRGVKNLFGRGSNEEKLAAIEEYCKNPNPDALGGDMMMISNEVEKLILYVGDKKRITLGDVETMVLAAKQRSLYELTDAISARNRPRALETLDAILTTGDGDEAAIGHLYMLAKTFRQMLVILERNVRDQRMLWAALWQGFRVPPFAAEDIIRQARRYKSKRELTRAIRLIARADLALRSNPPSKRMMLEKLVLDLTTEPKPEVPGWSQEELPV